MDDLVVRDARPADAPGMATAWLNAGAALVRAVEA